MCGVGAGTISKSEVDGGRGVVVGEKLTEYKEKSAQPTGSNQTPAYGQVNLGEWPWITQPNRNRLENIFIAGP